MNAVGFIGAGNMAGALVRGWASAGACPPRLVVHDVHSERATEFAKLCEGGESVPSNTDVMERSDIVVLGVKPQMLDDVVADVRPFLEREPAGPVVVSLLAGTSRSKLEESFPSVPVVRLMPNIAAEHRAATLCLSFPADFGRDRADAVAGLFAPLGRVVELPERLMDVATVAGGSGPALYAVVFEAFVDGCVDAGLPPQEATDFSLEVMRGAQALLEAQGGDSLGVRRRVTSAGGTTAAALGALEDMGVRAAFHAAIRAGVDRAREL